MAHRSVQRAVVGLALLLVLSGASGCWYNTTGRSGGNVGNIYIPFFQDDTSGDRAVNLGTRLTDLVVNEFQKDRSIRVFQGESERALADKELLGTVRRLTEAVQSRDPQETREEYRVVVTTSFTYTDLKTNKALWNEQSLSGDGYYLLEDGEAGFDTALSEALRKIVERIVDRTIKAW